MILGTVRRVPSAFNGPFHLGKVGCGGKPALDNLVVRSKQMIPFSHLVAPAKAGAQGGGHRAGRPGCPLSRA
jgi:hypothetical protein